MLLDTLKVSSEPELPAWNELARDLGSCGSSTLKWRSLSSSKVTISNSYERNSYFFLQNFRLSLFFLICMNHVRGSTSQELLKATYICYL